MPEKLTELHPEMGDQNQINKDINEDENKKTKKTAADEIVEKLSADKVRTQSTFRLPKRLYDEFAHICTIKGVSMNSVITNLMLDYIKDNQDYIK